MIFNYLLVKQNTTTNYGKLKIEEENKDIWEQTQANIWKQALNSIESMLDEELDILKKVK